MIRLPFCNKLQTCNISSTKYASWFTFQSSICELCEANFCYYTNELSRAFTINKSVSLIHLTFINYLYLMSIDQL